MMRVNGGLLITCICIKMTELQLRMYVYTPLMILYSQTHPTINFPVLIGGKGIDFALMHGSTAKCFLAHCLSEAILGGEEL